MSSRTTITTERDRNVDFDSDVEVDSLKDAVWRLTTRVYLLEDFIAEKFGEVLGPSGYSKASSPETEGKITSVKRSKVSPSSPPPPLQRNKRKRMRRTRQSTRLETESVEKVKESLEVGRDVIATGKQTHVQESPGQRHTIVDEDDQEEKDHTSRIIKSEVLSDVSDMDSDGGCAADLIEGHKGDDRSDENNLTVNVNREDRTGSIDYPYENKRVTLSFEKKLEILTELAKKTQAQVCREYSLSPSVVHRIKNSKINIKHVVDTGQSRRKRLKPSSHPDVDEALNEWAQAQRQFKHPINTTILLSKANAFYKHLHPEGDWVASQGWIGRFKERHGIKFRKSKGKNERIIPPENTNVSTKVQEQPHQIRDSDYGDTGAPLPFTISTILPHQNQ